MTAALLAVLALPLPAAPAPPPRPPRPAACRWEGRWSWGQWDVTLAPGGGYEARRGGAVEYLGFWRADGGHVVVEEWPAGQSPASRSCFRLEAGPERALSYVR